MNNEHRTMNTLIAGCWLLIALLVFSGRASAQVPHLIRYQGRAVDNTNNQGLEGNYALTFRLCTAATGDCTTPPNPPLWQEQHPNVPLMKGHFSVLLGNGTPPAPLTGIDWTQPVWLSVSINGGSELLPRQRITSVPLALRAEVAESLSNPTDISARVFNSAAISIHAATETTLTFDSERWDTDAIHSTTSNTSRLTATTAGKYFIFGNVEFAGNPDGRRYLYIRHNPGATQIVMHTEPGTDASNTSLSVATHWNMAAGDYVELVAHQSSRTSLNINVGYGNSPEFGMVKVP